MGYYADLITEKRNAGQKVQPFVIGLYGYGGKELKTPQEVEAFMREQEREEKQHFSWVLQMEKKLEETEKEPKPHSIDWAQRLSKYRGLIKTYKRGLEIHEDWKWKAKEWLDKNRSKFNSKEEKDNESTVEKFDHYGTKIEIIKTDSGEFRYRVSKKGNFKESMTVSTLSEARRDAIKQAETWANEKEEKDNEAPEIATARRKALQKLEDAQKKANWYGDETMKKLKHDLTYADEENLLDVVGVLERYLPKFEAKVKSFGNSKGEDMNYYAKLAEEKKNASAEDSEKIKRQIVSVEAYLKDRLEWQKSVNKEVEGCQRELARLKKMLGNNNSKEEEEGYYAKLAEEKASRKN